MSEKKKPNQCRCPADGAHLSFCPEYKPSETVTKAPEEQPQSEMPSDREFLMEDFLQGIMDAVKLGAPESYSDVPPFLRGASGPLPFVGKSLLPNLPKPRLVSADYLQDLLTAAIDLLDGPTPKPNSARRLVKLALDEISPRKAADFLG